MPRQPTRFRRVILGVTLALLAVVVAAWGVSYWKKSVLSYGDVVRVGTTSERDVTHGVDVRVRFLTFASTYGSFVWTCFSKQDHFESARWQDLDPLLQGWCASIRPAVPFRGGSALAHHTGLDPDLTALGVEIDVVSDHYCMAAGLAIPYWLTSLSLAGLAFWLWFPQRRSARRRAEGLCLRCGYDRKGLAPAAACPECGETPAPAPPAA